MTKPATDALYTRVSRETRYKGKNFVETAVWRFGDVVVTSAVSGLRLLGVGVGGLALLGAGVASLAAWVATGAGWSADLASDEPTSPAAERSAAG
jgi:AAA family ATP:ADP antiporter